ncbi:MAG: [FeFe] hydrogenase H-cluster maturation GTPase HydF [Alistipes sp.]|nr:[FeFe] hydrogenase H-cluster maturation GTPase HydF [Alistipes sp.]
MALTTPTSERVHISLFGRTNAGKSTLMNRLVGYDIAIVSPTAGTTTDPVQKAIEINGLGAAIIIDTPGLDDYTELGGERMARTAKVLDKTDIAVVLFTSEGGDAEMQILEECRVREIPTIVAVNQVDRLESSAAVVDAVAKRTGAKVIAVSALTGEGVDALREAIVACRGEEERYITEGFCKAGDRVLLVMPQDKAAPKGRLIQPQVQTIRELLDRGCIPICCTPDRMAEALASLGSSPELIITDSQAFNDVYQLKPEESTLTSFSILFARYKGDIKLFTEGVKALKNINENSRVLIAEACTHTPQNEDIGRVKLPRILRKKFGEGLHIDIVGGAEYPEDLTQYDLVIHCGACMFNRRHVLSRIERARKQGVAITNYGVILAALGGILDRVRVE